jgi:hypothetical protein
MLMLTSSMIARLAFNKVTRAAFPAKSVRGLVSHTARSRYHVTSLPFATAPMITASSLSISSLSRNCLSNALSMDETACRALETDNSSSTMLRQVGVRRRDDITCGSQTYYCIAPASSTSSIFLHTFPIRAFLTSFSSERNCSSERAALVVNFDLTAMVAKRLGVMGV